MTRQESIREPSIRPICTANICLFIGLGTLGEIYLWIRYHEKAMPVLNGPTKEYGRRFYTSTNCFPHTNDLCSTFIGEPSCSLRTYASIYHPAIVVAYRPIHAHPFVDMLNPSSVEDSRVVMVLAMPSEIVKNLTDKTVPYALAAGHFQCIYSAQQTAFQMSTSEALLMTSLDSA